MVDQDENESGNPGHTHPGASALLWGGVFYRERGESRVASRLTDSSESEEDLSSDDPEQEGAALDVRSAAKERRGIGCPRTAALKKNTHNGPDTNKRNKKRAMMIILCSFSPCPDDALLARGATYRKDSLYYFEKRIVGLTDELRGKMDLLSLIFSKRRKSQFSPVSENFPVAD